MAEILRRMELRGDDLQTNREVHYGLIQWFLGRGVMAEPTTRFMTSYLGAVGALAAAREQTSTSSSPSRRLVQDASDAGCPRGARGQGDAAAASARRACSRMRTCSRGFLGRYDGELWKADGAEARFEANPVDVLERLYHFLDLEARADKPPAEQIWEHDAAVLDAAHAFYAAVEARTGAQSADELGVALRGQARAALCPAATTRSGRAAWRRTAASSSASSSCC